MRFTPNRSPKTHVFSDIMMFLEIQRVSYLEKQLSTYATFLGSEILLLQHNGNKLLLEWWRHYVLLQYLSDSWASCFAWLWA